MNSVLLMSTVLQVEGLSKKYHTVEAVAGLSLTVNSGEIVGLLGPNGAGKTTALECMMGLRRASAGKITIDGHDIARDLKQVREKMGVQLQATALPEHLRVGEALRLFASFYADPAPLDSLIDTFHLREHINRPFHVLSGGQKQRLAMALAVINKPKIIFLDEPTAAMDPQARRDVYEQIRQLRAAGAGILLATHHLDEAEQWCDRVVIMDHGQLMACDSPAALIAQTTAQTRLIVTSDKAIPLTELIGQAAITHLTLSEFTYTVSTQQVNQSLIALIRALEQHGAQILDITIKKPSLEDVFLHLTGRSLRD
jgi:ABC-2 type transport system ATP-binding protein